MEESTHHVSKVSKKRHSKAISWSQKENDYFLSLVKKRKHSIARKEGRNKKSQAWAEIVEEMKDFFGPKYSPSDMRRIRTKWQKMKTKAQAEIDNLKNQSIKQLSNQSQIVCDILNVNLNDNGSQNYITRKADKKNDSAFSKSLQSNDEFVNAFPINILKTEKDSGHIKETDNERDLSLFMENSQINEIALESESDGHIEVANEQELNKNNFDDENINGPNQSQVSQTAGGGDIDPGYEQDGSKVFDMLKLDILIKKKSAISAIWETAEINKMIAVQKLKSLIQCQQETLGMSSGQLGDLGSGAGKGGGGGGSIREAGGSFGKMEAAREEEYFYKQQKQQLSQLKDGLTGEISFHEEQIKRHQEAIARHKTRVTDIEKQEQ